MTRAVLDANVLISAAVASAYSSSTMGILVGALRDDGFDLVLSEPILAEIRRNLPNVLDQMRIEQYRAEEFIVLLLDIAGIVEITSVIPGVATHPEDDLVLATAVLGEVEFLVTGDKQLLALSEYRGVRIITPREFVERCLS